MVDYPIGDLIAERVRAMGVKPFYKQFKHDGVNGPNMATVYSDRGQGVRAPVVFYNRSQRSGGAAEAGRFRLEGDLRAAACAGSTSGGIFAALSPTTAEVIIEGMQAAKAAGAVTSFDLNYRAKLWNISGGEERAVAVLDRIVKNVDVLVGNEEDLQKGLGIPGPEVAAKSKLDPSAFFGMIDKVSEEASAGQGRGDDAARSALHQPPQLGRGGVDQRQDVHSRRRPSSTCYDRVGGGDGFASGFFYGLLTGESPEEAVKLGWAHGALLTTFPGDTTMATVEQVRAFAKGGSARIQRS